MKKAIKEEVLEEISYRDYAKTGNELDIVNEAISLTLEKVKNLIDKCFIKWKQNIEKDKLNDYYEIDNKKLIRIRMLERIEKELDKFEGVNEDD